jgi:DNA-directed RNA polymerase specialized sigma24 family protein
MSEPAVSALIDELYRRHGLALQARCRLLAGSTASGNSIATECLARLVMDENPAQTPEEIGIGLMVASTELFLKRLASPQGRDTEWLGTLERHRTQASPAKTPMRETLVDLLGRTDAVNRAPVIYRYLDRLPDEAIAKLVGKTPAELAERIDRFHELACSFLEKRGDAPLEKPAPLDSDTPLALLADEAPTDEQVAEAIESIQGIIEHLTSKADVIKDKKTFGPQIWAPALVATVFVGLVLWLGLPSPTPPGPNVINDQGGFSLEVLLHGPDGVRLVKPGETLPSGLQLKFRLGASTPVMAALALLPERGEANFIGPEKSPGWPVPTGHLSEPPFSHRLGAERGPERVFALFCPMAAPLHFLPDMLEYAYRPGEDGKRDLERDFEGAPRYCSLRSLLFKKGPPIIHRPETGGPSP